MDQTERTGPRQEAGSTITSTDQILPLTPDELAERARERQEWYLRRKASEQALRGDQAERRRHGLRARHARKLRRGRR